MKLLAAEKKQTKEHVALAEAHDWKRDPGGPFLPRALAHLPRATQSHFKLPFPLSYRCSVPATNN